jgi:hypothetical protein
VRAAARIACALVIAGILGSCSLFDYSGMVSKRYALVYGISSYSITGQPKNPNLTYPDVDASAVNALLVSKGYTVVQSRWVDPSGNLTHNGTPAGTIGTPTDDGTGNLLNPGTAPEAPSKGVIISDIESLASVVGPNDLVLVYFSGHGMMDTLVPPSTHQYIIPYEGVQLYPGGPSPHYYGVPAYSIRDDELRASLDTLPTNRKVIIFDTCNSGGFIGDSLEADATPPSLYTGTVGVTPAIISAAIANYASFPTSSTGLSPYGATVIAAAGRDESSYEDGSPYNHGIMTYYLLQTAQKGDLNHDSHVTVGEAFSLIKAGIDQQWNSDPNIIAAQQTFDPHISGGPVDFVLW